LRRRVDPPPLVARKRPLLVVAGDDVLAELRAEGLEDVAQVADEREIADDRVALLRHVIQRNQDQKNDDTHDGPQAGRHDTEILMHPAIRMPGYTCAFTATASRWRFTAMKARTNAVTTLVQGRTRSPEDRTPGATTTDPTRVTSTRKATLDVEMIRE